MAPFLRMLPARLAYCLVPVATLWCGVTTDGRLLADEFRPIKEAELPEAFPTYTQVGQIDVKLYPPHRKAVAAGVGQFWVLFQHITQADVKMTTPVEMDYGDPRTSEVIKGSMGFFYENTDQGTTGEHGSVQVIDVPPTRVVSIGCRGSISEQAVSDARDNLMEYLSKHKDRFSIAGSLRVMGYNSPFVPIDRSFFEVQIPVSEAAADQLREEGETRNAAVR